MLISLADFKNYYNITIDAYDYQINQYIEEFSDLIARELGFELTTDTATSQRFHGQTAGLMFLNIGLWSPVDLLVKKGYTGDTDAELETLVFDSDYTLEYPGGISSSSGYPIHAVKLLTHKLYYHDFIQVIGARGFGSSVPKTIEMLIKQATWYKLNNFIQQKASFESGGAIIAPGGKFSEKSQTWSVTIDNADYAQDILKLVNGDFLNTAPGRVFKKYKIANQSNTICT